jgi:hypothetical protein
VDRRRAITKVDRRRNGKAEILGRQARKSLSEGTMTETEWLCCDDPGLMLNEMESKTSDRKFRLFAVACCRRMWHLLGEESTRKVVEITEMFADGLVTPEAHKAAIQSAYNACKEPHDVDPATAAYLIAWYPSFAAAQTCGTISVIMDRTRRQDDPDWWTTHISEGEEEAKHQVSLLRCVFGDHFRPVNLDAALLTQKVKTLAQSIYDDRAFERMPELADALAEAGCSNPDILSHCRGPGTHVRGCWVVDLVLGKE